MTRYLILVGILAQAVPVGNCGKTVVVNGPKTGECPAGRYVVTYDDTKNPPEASYRCEKPTTPPSAEPSTAPSATPPPATTTTTTTTTTLPPTPPPVADACPAPFAVKLGFGQNPPKNGQGYRNTASITPLVRGACVHKGNPAPDAECATDEGCADHQGSPYQVRYGQPQAYQTGTGFDHDPVERATDGCNRNDPGIVPCGYNLTFATGSPALWTSGRYKEAGPMEVCVSMPNLLTERCQRGVMGEDGKMVSFGTNDQGYDKPKLRGAKYPAGLREGQRARVRHP